MSEWFTADPHLGHANIIKYCNRPFTSADEMDEVILARLNERVAEQDTLYILGDFAFGKDRRLAIERYERYRARIRCQHIVLIIGNHDPHDRLYQPRKELFRVFENVFETLYVRIPFNEAKPIVMPWEDADDVLRWRNDRAIYLHHYACRTWPHSHHGAWHLFGHSHGALKDDEHSLSFDCGVDCHNFYPLSVDEVVAIMSKKSWTPPFLREETNHDAIDHSEQ